jgi:hypothetical protein
MNTPAQAPTPGPSDLHEQERPWKLVTLFAFAVCGLGTLILITRVDSNPSETNWFVYLTVLALAAGGIAALLPGAINFEVPGSVKAGGALAVVALIFYVGGSKATLPQTPSATLSMNSFLHFDEKTSAPTSPFDPDVYVFVNSKVAKADVVSKQPLYAVEDKDRSSTIEVVRAMEYGLGVKFTKLLPGDKLYVIVYSQSGEWRSDDLVIPENNFRMTPVPPKGGP